MLDELQGFTPVGKGAMGVVYRATDRAGRAVAVKSLLVDAAAEVVQQGLEVEAQALARLNHPGIVALLGFGVATGHGVLSDGTSWLVTEYCSGGTLSQPGRRLSTWTAARRLLGDVLEALAHAHAHGVLHRDLKLANLLVASSTDARPGLKVADFGIAAFGSRAAIAMGTPSYMAPEQIDGESDLGPTADLYALGVIGWVLATGKLPIEERGRALLLAKSRGALVDFVPRFSVPDGVEAWLRRLMAVDPGDRFPSAWAAAVELPVQPGAPSTAARRRVDPPPPPQFLLEASRAILPLRSAPLLGRDAAMRAVFDALANATRDGVAQALSVQGPAGPADRFVRGACVRLHELAGARAVVTAHRTVVDAAQRLMTGVFGIDTDREDWRERLIARLSALKLEDQDAVRGLELWARVESDPRALIGLVREVVAAAAQRVPVAIGLVGGADLAPLAQGLASIDGRVVVLTDARPPGMAVLRLDPLPETVLGVVANHLLPLSPREVARLASWADGDDHALVEFLRRARVARTEHGTFELLDELPRSGATAYRAAPHEQTELAVICWPPHPVRRDQITAALGGPSRAAHWEGRLRAEGRLQTDGRWWLVRAAWQGSVLAGLSADERRAAARTWAEVLQGWSQADPALCVRAWLEAGEVGRASALLADGWREIQSRAGAVRALDLGDAVLAARRDAGVPEDAEIDGPILIMRYECLQRISPSREESRTQAGSLAAQVRAKGWSDTAALFEYLAASLDPDQHSSIRGLQDALAEARTPWTHGVIHEMLANRHLGEGQPSVAAEHFRAAIELLESQRKPSAVRRASALRADLAALAGDMAGARTWTARALEVCDDAVHRSVLLRDLAHFTLIDDPMAAAKLLDEAGTLCQLTENGWKLAHVRLDQACVALLEGDPEAARGPMREASALGTERDRSLLVLYRLVAALLESRWVDARAELAGVRVLLASPHWPDPVNVALIQRGMDATNLPLDLAVELHGVLELERTALRG